MASILARVRDVLAKLAPGVAGSRHLDQTEENLNRTFDEAEKSEAELSFEESDELFDQE